MLSFDKVLGALVAFGQSEALTTRLRNIISAYVEGPGVLCELVQNADDAAATEVSFLLDTRSFGTNSVLSEYFLSLLDLPFGCFKAISCRDLQKDSLGWLVRILLCNVGLGKKGIGA